MASLGVVASVLLNSQPSCNMSLTSVSCEGEWDWDSLGEVQPYPHSYTTIILDWTNESPMDIPDSFGLFGKGAAQAAGGNKNVSIVSISMMSKTNITAAGDGGIFNQLTGSIGSVSIYAADSIVVDGNAFSELGKGASTAIETLSIRATAGDIVFNQDSFYRMGTRGPGDASFGDISIEAPNGAISFNGRAYSGLGQTGRATITNSVSIRAGAGDIVFTQDSFCQMGQNGPDTSASFGDISIEAPNGAISFDGTAFHELGTHSGTATITDSVSIRAGAGDIVFTQNSFYGNGDSGGSVIIGQGVSIRATAGDIVFAQDSFYQMGTSGGGARIGHVSIEAPNGAISFDGKAYFKVGQTGGTAAITDSVSIRAGAGDIVFTQGSFYDMGQYGTPSESTGVMSIGDISIEAPNGAISFTGTAFFNLGHNGGRATITDSVSIRAGAGDIVFTQDSFSKMGLDSGGVSIGDISIVAPNGAISFNAMSFGEIQATATLTEKLTIQATAGITAPASTGITGLATLISSNQDGDEDCLQLEVAAAGAPSYQRARRDPDAWLATVATCPTVCGDGKRVGVEVCDDNNTAPNDGCSTDCAAVETGFRCTLGNVNTANTCVAKCGDGKRVGTEACDDGNTVSDDGCSNDCAAVETGYDCTGGSGSTADTCFSVAPTSTYPFVFFGSAEAAGTMKSVYIAYTNARNGNLQRSIETAARRLVKEARESTVRVCVVLVNLLRAGLNSERVDLEDFTEFYGKVIEELGCSDV